MDLIRTDNYGGVSGLLDSMDTTIGMLEAFAAMLGYTLTSGDGVGNISWGAESIVRQQCQDLQFIRKALREQFDALHDAKDHPNRSAVHG